MPRPFSGMPRGCCGVGTKVQKKTRGGAILWVVPLFELTSKLTRDKIARMSNKAGSEDVVDLRSDTVTRPTPAMRRAMAEAEVGDDVYGEDPTVNRLQARAAEIFEREAALFVPSGSMGNLLAINSWVRPGTEVICEQRAHIHDYEMVSISAIAG